MTDQPSAEALKLMDIIRALGRRVSFTQTDDEVEAGRLIDAFAAAAVEKAVAAERERWEKARAAGWNAAHGIGDHDP